MISVKKPAISFYGETSIWCWKELQSWAAVKWKAWTVFCMVLISSLLVLKIHSFGGWPEFTHYIDTLSGTNEWDSLCPALCVGMDFTYWQIGGPLKSTAFFKKKSCDCTISPIGHLQKMDFSSPRTQKGLKLGGKELKPLLPASSYCTRNEEIPGGKPEMCPRLMCTLCMQY